MLSSVAHLPSGHEIPLVGSGLWKAIKVGDRHFDGAYVYQNEKEAGEDIQRAIRGGLVRREDVFITTKLWNHHHNKEHAIAMAKFQNEQWGLGYIELRLFHSPIALQYIDPATLRYPAWWQDLECKSIALAKVPLQETWQALEEALDAGIARSIGISNAQAQTLYDIDTYSRHPVSALQVEHHPYLVQPELISLDQEKGILVTAYSAFGPQSFLELPPAFRERASNIPPLWHVEPVQHAARRTGKTSAQILLRWSTQRGIAVIPKSNNPGRLQQNLEVLDFELKQDEMDAISALDKGLRFNDPGHYLDVPIRLFA